MKTKEEIKNDILATNPSRKYIINDEEFEMSDEEFNDAVDKRIDMEFEQQNRSAEITAAKSAILEKLGITEEEAKLLLA